MIEQRLENCEKELAAIRKELQAKPGDRFVPKLHEPYWYVDSIGDYGSEKWRDSHYDHFRLATGNCHRTKEDARRYKASLFLKTPTGPCPKVGDMLYNWAHSSKKARALRKFLPVDDHVVAWWNDGGVCIEGYEAELEAKWRKYGWSVTGEPEPEGWES